LSRSLIIVAIILALAAVLLATYIRRLLRKSRQVEQRIDYSKMRAWDDDDW
jgi:membrane protein implicated in regulation of membrane protease activity